MIVVLRLTADEYHSVDRAGSAEHFTTRHWNAAVTGPLVRLGGIAPVRDRVIDELGVADWNTRPEMPFAAGFQYENPILAVRRQPVRNGGPGGAGANYDIIEFREVLAHERCLSFISR